jgi:hypothetical protein
VDLKVDLQPYESRNSPRLCKRYCNALLLAGELGPRCPHCAHCEWLIELFGRRP